MIRERSYIWRYWEQVVALVRKNLLLGYRNWRSTVVQLCASFFFLVLLLLIDVSVRQSERGSGIYSVVRSPEAEVIPAIPECTEDMYITTAACKDILYSPVGDPVVEEIMGRIKANNPGRPIPDDRVMGFATAAEVDEYLAANPDTVISAVHFNKLSDTEIHFGIQTNSTLKYFKGNFQNPNEFVRLPLQNAVHREITRQFVKGSAGEQAADALEWDLQISEFPHPALEVDSIEGTVSPFFIFAAAMFGFVIQVIEIVTEKEKNLRLAMRTMGLLDSAYWTSWMVWHFISNFVSALLLCIFGLILQFKIFLRNDFGVVFILILFFMQAMTGCAYLLASFLMRSQTATILGFGVVLVGWILQVVVQFGVPFTPEYVDDYDGALTIVFGMMPWTLLSKALGDLGSATAGDLQGLNSSELGSYCKDFSDLSFTEWPEDVCFPDDPGKYVSCNCVVPIDTILWILVLEWIGYTLIAIYVDNVFPQEAGTRRAPWYFLTPGYWSTAWADRHIAARGPRTLTRIDLTNATPHHDDEDVMAAFEAAKARLARIQSGEEGVESQEQAVELFNLRKVFGSFDAVKGSWLGIRKDELFCLLGPNGAGKSTTINLLTGVLKPSAGEAVVYGQLLQSAGGMDRIRSMMGVCPQFDVLWDRLTGSEHMLIYGQIKGVEPSRLASHSDDLLGQVRLLSSANLRTAGYSGGMKRRLSVAIALLGDPSIVYLDEPTTGMDPISRRHVWDIIEASKKGRSIVLTTHSMEEADILGDRIAIMARGAVRCIGSSIRLKARFGAGYQIAVAVVKGGEGEQGMAEQRREGVKKLFRERMGIAPHDDNGAYMTFVVPREHTREVVALLETLERSSRQLGVADVQLSMTSLEEVFLNIAKQAEIDEAQRKGTATKAVALPGGGTIFVPIGADTITDAQGVVWRVVWAQSEDGSLEVMDLKPVEQ